MERLDLLEQIRTEKGFSRRELAEYSGVSEPTIKSLEKGITNVNCVKLETLIRLSSVLKVKVVDLLPKEIRRKIR